MYTKKFVLRLPRSRVSRPNRVSHLAVVLVTLVAIIAVSMFADIGAISTPFDDGGIHTSAGLGDKNGHALTPKDHAGCGPTPGCVLATAPLSGHALSWVLTPTEAKRFPTDTILTKKKRTYSI